MLISVKLAMILQVVINVNSIMAGILIPSNVSILPAIKANILIVFKSNFLFNTIKIVHANLV